MLSLTGSAVSHGLPLGGAAGIALKQLGPAGVLMLAPGAVGVDIASGILLYRVLTVGLEIPVGGAMLALWSWRAAQLRTS